MSDRSALQSARAYRRFLVNPAFLFLAPALLGLLVFKLVPIVVAVVGW